ncbi:TnpV protein, partial [Lachnospiraceae bacterium 48-42]
MKSIFEQLGGTYHEENGYLIPDLRLPTEEEQPIGTWGQRHLDYLKQYRRVIYTNLLTSGKLNAYLADIDRQAQECFERLIEGMKQAQGITERLKEENALEWTVCGSFFHAPSFQYGFWGTEWPVYP